MLTQFQKNCLLDLIALLIFLLLWALHHLISRLTRRSRPPPQTTDHTAASQLPENRHIVEVESGGALQSAAAGDGAVKLVYDTFVDGKEEGGEDDECAICLEEYKEDDKRAAIVACGHRFHAGCMLTWVVIHGTCPLCRTAA